MKSKFRKFLAAALVLCLMLALLPVGVLADNSYSVTFYKSGGTEQTSPNGTYALGTITATGTTGDDDKFQENTEVTLTATPTTIDDHLCGISYLKVNDKEITVPKNSDVFTHKFTITKDTKVVAEFRRIFTISQETVTGVTFTELSSSSMSGETVSFDVEVERGYKLNSVYYTVGDGTDQTPITLDETLGKWSFDMPANDIKISADVESRSDSYNITIPDSAHGTVTTSPSGTAYYNERVTVNVTPEDGFQLKSLTLSKDDGSEPQDIDGSYTFKMPSYNVKLVAEFETKPEPVPETHDVQVSYSTGGTVTASPNTNVAKGAPVTLTVTPAEGYWLKSLKIDGVEFANYVDWSYFWYYKYGTVSFTMTDADVSVYAEFTDQLYVFTNYNGYRGEVEVLVKDDASGEWVDTNFADKGDWVAFKPVAYTGFNIGAISVTGNWTGWSYDVETWYWHNGWYYFQMPWENVTINVEFTDNSHAVNVKDASNGTLKTNTKWAVEDERVYITAVPDKGYELTWLSVKAEDGTRVDVYEALKEDTYYFFMPDQAVTVSAIFAYDYPDMPFTDVNSNSWYFNAVEFVYNKGIMQGVSSTKFSPNGTVTRGMLVTMLWRMAGEPYVGGGSFDDVASGSYYATAVAWAAKNGIVDGYNSTRFGPNDAVTREQIATMLYRYAKWLGYSTSGSSLAGYSDASSVSSWAKDAMGWAVKNSVVTGVTATKLNPTSSATRAETAQMFMNFYEYLN